MSEIFIPVDDELFSTLSIGTPANALLFLTCCNSGYNYAKISLPLMQQKTPYLKTLEFWR